ncbi:hypothetical protein AAZX31_09G108500 [Glycine max]
MVKIIIYSIPIFLFHYFIIYQLILFYFDIFSSIKSPLFFFLISIFFFSSHLFSSLITPFLLITTRPLRAMDNTLYQNRNLTADWGFHRYCFPHEGEHAAGECLN